MKADDPSAARDAAVSPANEAAESYTGPKDSATSLGVFQEVSPPGAENVSGVPLSDGYQEDQAEETPYDGGKMVGASGNIEYYEEERQEFLSMGPIPTPPAASTVAAGGVGAHPPQLQQEGQGQNAVPSASAVAIDGSATVSAVKITSEASSLAPPADGIPIMEQEYSGMPKIDADIEVGKKIVRRRKLSIACPPSSFYSDVEPPGMELVQRALRNHKTNSRPSKRQQPRYQATEFHDDKGHMLLYGCLDGKYVGDVLGGLPHGHGQHWTPSPGCKSAPGYRHLLYEGAWQYGAKTGYGRMFYHNGQVVAHKDSLFPQQMQALRLAFDKLSPGYYRRTMVNRIQIRRMILLARLDPDSEMGKRLFVNLQEAAIPTAGLTYNNFMKTVLQFHYPREAMPYKRRDSAAKE